MNVASYFSISFIFPIFSSLVNAHISLMLFDLSQWPQIWSCKIITYVFVNIVEELKLKIYS